MKIDFNRLLIQLLAVALSVYLICFFFACSGKYHYKKALKKGVTCEQTSDTIKMFKLDSFLVQQNDTFIYRYKVTEYDTIVKFNTVFVPKTRYEIKTEYKLKRDTLKTVRYIVKEQRKEATQPRKSTNRFILILLILFSLIILAFKFKK